MNFLDKKNIIILIILIFIICLSIYFFTKEEDYEHFDADSFHIETNTTTSTQEVMKIVIHIDGEVINPGIVTLSEGARIDDAIFEAGGASELADISKVNLAYELKDGQKIYIPSIYDETDITYVHDSAGENVVVSDENSSNLININTANQSELETLPGIRRIYSQKNN